MVCVLLAGLFFFFSKFLHLQQGLLGDLSLQGGLHPGREIELQPTAAEPPGEHNLQGGDHPVMTAAAVAEPGT